MGVAKGYQFPLVCHAMGVQALDAKTEAKIQRTAQRLSLIHIYMCIRDRNWGQAEENYRLCRQGRCWPGSA